MRVAVAAGHPIPNRAQALVVLAVLVGEEEDTALAARRQVVRPIQAVVEAAVLALVLAVQEL
jgi:hypothetical protein